MIITIITGLCGSGKSTFCKLSQKPTLIYDSIFSYSSISINKNLVDQFMNEFKDSEEIYLDAYNLDLINYIKNNYKPTTINFKFIYTDLDDNYDIISRLEPRDFGQHKYDDYINSMKTTISDINNGINSVIELYTNKEYLYRKDNNYTVFNDDKHLLNMLNESKANRLINYIKSISGHSTYQSIILDNNYIQRGSERDWITLDNVLKCVDLNDKVICDTGCFNGYFSFKALEHGASKVIGIDKCDCAIPICNKLCVYNNYHLWKMGNKTDVSCKKGIEFYLYKIGDDKIFNEITLKDPIDIIFAFNYLHHLINQYGIDVFKMVVDDFFKNTKEIVFEINESEFKDINDIALKNNFKLKNKLQSHRRTSYGNRLICYYNNI